MKQHYCQIFIISIFFFLLGNTLSAQCPDLTSESLDGADCMPGTTACDVCAGDDITLNAGGTGLPDGGTLDWYYSTTPGFNPYNGEGTFIGSADISTPSSSNPCDECPEILGLMVDACSGEDNEFMIMSSGSGFAVNDLTVDFPVQNDGLGSVNDDINFPGGNCTWGFPDVSLINGTGCNNVVAAGPGTVIPENSPVIVFVSSAATVTFDFSALCITGVTVYVMQSTCDRLIGAFSNGSANGTRTITTGLANCSCADDMITYNTDDLTLSTDGDFVIDVPFFGITYGNSGCNFPMGVPPFPGPSPTVSTVDPLTYTVPQIMCNGGPYYAIGILNPAPTAPCVEEMTQPLEFNVICPVANPISTDVCLNPNGNTFIDLTQFESGIAGGSGLPVNWFTDPAGMNPVPPPLNNVLVDPSEPNFYATIGSGSCISDLVTLTVNIASGPDVSNLTFILNPTMSCGPANVEVVFNFPGGGMLDIVMDVGGANWQNSVLSGVPYFIGNLSQTTNVSLISVGEGNCISTLMPPLVETFTVENPPQAVGTSLESCEDANGDGTFDLTTIESVVNFGTGEPVNWFEDMGFTSISFPQNYTINSSTTIFANVGTPPCVSSFVPIVLTIYPAPSAFTASLDGCDDGNGFANFDLTSLNGNVNGGNGNTVTWYESQNPNTIISSPQNYNSSGGSVFAIVSDGQCLSDFVEITLNVVAGGMPTLLDETLCETDGLFDLSQLEDSNFPTGTWSGNGVSGDFFNPSGQVPNATLIFTPSGDCSQAAMATITVNAAETPTLLTADICESDGTIDLNTLVVNNTFLPGNWTGDGVQSDGMTFDPVGQSNPVTVTFISAVDCTNSEITTITIQSVNTLILQTGETCESDGLFNLNDLLPANATTGTWTGTGVETDGFNFNPSGLLGPNTVTFTPDENCVSGGMTTVTVYGNEMTLMEETYCSGSGDFIEVGTDIYDESTPTGMTTLQTFNGCDSTVNVNLIFTTPQQGTYENTLCPGGFETIGGTVFDENMPSGIATLQTPTGCDSTVMVTLTFENEVTNNINETYCSGSGNFIEVGNDIYDEITPMGTTTLQTPSGCDSIVNVNLIFTTPQQGTYENTLCPGNFETIGGTVFDENMPSGIATLQTPTGCDSTVMVTLTFENEVTNNINETYCSGSGDFVEVGSDIYNETTPTGTTTLQTPAGCDSIVNVNLIFTTPQQGTYTNTFCSGGSITIGGTLFNESMPTGIATVQTPAGCDSTVMVTLTYANEVTNNINETYCSGSGDFIEVGSDIYDETTPTGTTTLQTPAGCDSTVNVNLIFTTPQQGTYTNTFCPGGSITIGGTLFNESMPTGIATVQTPAGCDSTVMVTLTFENEVTNNINETYCSGSGDFVEVGSDIYDETTPTGTTTLQTPAGCDSTVNVNLIFTTPQQGTYTNTFCPGGSITIGGTLFNESMPTGIATVQTPAGCDSTVMVTLTYANEVTNNINETYCSGSGDFVEVGSDIYDETTPTGTTTLQTPAGCDSTVNVNLIFTTPQQGTYTNTLCPGGFETIGGTVFDENMPSGIATLQTPTGCDSTVMVTLTFANEVTNNISETYCSGSGDFVEVGNDIYDETTPTGTTTLQTPSGCDSIVNVNLIFTTPQQGTYTNTLCPGGFETIGGTVFDENMPSGIATLQTPTGCDSTVMVTLTFENEVTNNINETYCSGSGDFVEVGNDIYDETTPTGTTTLQTPSGCDSIVNVNLIFTTPQQGTYTNTLCPGGFETIGGTVFDENMPSGIATLQTPSGCDSTVMVTLTYSNEVVANITETLCPDEFIIIDGVTYDENNTMGGTTIPNGSYLGCDSTTNVSISFYPEATSDYMATLDIDETIDIGGVTFSSTNPSGIVTLPMSSVNGCDSTINVNLQFTTELEMELSAFPPFCAGESTGGITIDTVENLNLPLYVFLNGDIIGLFVEFPIEINNLSAGLYTVEVANTIGEITAQEIVVPNAPVLTLNVGNDETIRLGDVIELSGQTNANDADWQWTPPLFLECDTCLTTLATPLESTIYTLTGTTPEGCTVSDNLTILIERGDAVFAPNVFSPNNDGVNDMFYIHATNEVAIIRNFRIFDRWGANVFDRAEILPNEPLMGWNGMHKGKVVEQGVYVYFAEIELVDGQMEMIKGDVTVMR